MTTDGSNSTGSGGAIPATRGSAGSGAGGGIRRRMRGHSRVVPGALTLLAGVVIFGGLQTFRAVAVAIAQAEYTETLTTSRASQASAANAIARADAKIAAARVTLTDSAGKVLSEEPRAALAATLVLATTQVAAAREQLSFAKEGISATTTDPGYLSPGAGLRTVTATLTALQFDDATELTTLTDALASPVQAVKDAVALWQADFDRIVRERYTNNTHAIGWYPELDECVGSVDVTAHYGVPTIAEHWSCGGRDFPDDAGTIITLTGVHAGSYRVEGIAVTLNANRDSTKDLPRGFDLLYQTCQNGQSTSMSFTGLTRLEVRPLPGTSVPSGR